MSDPDELRALAGKMAEAAIYRAIDLDGFWAISPEDAAQVAIDHYAPTVARLEAALAAARQLIKAQDSYMAMQKLGHGLRRDPGPTIDRLSAARKRWAALEGGTDE